MNENVWLRRVYLNLEPEWTTSTVPIVPKNMMALGVFSGTIKLQ